MVLDRQQVHRGANQRVEHEVVTREVLSQLSGIGTCLQHADAFSRLDRLRPACEKGPAEARMPFEVRDHGAGEHIEQGIVSTRRIGLREKHFDRFEVALKVRGDPDRCMPAGQMISRRASACA